MSEFQGTYSEFREKLSPESIKQTLTLAALYITTYELLKRTIISCVETTNWLDFDMSGYVFGEKLTEKRRKEFEELSGVRIKGDFDDLEDAIRVKFKHDYEMKYKRYKRAYTATEDRVPLDSEMGKCCLWLVENEVIDGDEIKDVERITKHRDEIAHELPDFLISLDLDVNLDHLKRAIELVRKIEAWRVELEKSVEPDASAREQEWTSLRLLLLDQILSAALSG